MNTQTTRSKTAARRRRAGKNRVPLERADWVAEARGLLISGGINAVKVGHLARNLGVSREAFYWHFKSLSDLCDELISDWERRNSAAYRALLDPTKRTNGADEFRMIINSWVQEDLYSPSWDAVLRDWARTSKAVAKVVKRVDEMRIGVIEQMFRDMGYEELEATVRARVTYFHQIGYYAIGMEESAERRKQLLPMYIRVITGKPILG